MKTFLRSLALVAFGAVMFYGIGIAVAGAPAAGGKPCPGCPQAAADNAARPPMMDKMMESMKAHLEEMKGAVAALRESEKKLEGTEDPKAFRGAVLDHLKKLDDLQAAHLTHMESMMGRMHDGMPGMGHRHGRDCGCPECAGKDGCRCKCDCGAECGHKH